MKKLIERFSDFVKGTINGFDRIVFIRSTSTLWALSGAHEHR